MTPLFDKVLIQIQKAETLSSSGIYLPDKEEKLEKATIIKMGPDCVSNLKENDTIVFKGYNADTIVIEDIEYHFIKEEDILACISTTTK